MTNTKTYTENEAWQAVASCTNRVDIEAAKEAISKGKYRLAVLIADPEVEGNQARQILTPFIHPSKQACLDRIKEAQDSGNTIKFCTNSMLSRGNVYTCTIDKDGIATCVDGSSWWAMSYASAPELVGRVLGAVTAEMVPGNTIYQLKVAHMWEGRG